MIKSNTYCVMTHTGMAIQNFSDFCSCNVNQESWKNGKHEVMYVYKHQIKDAFKSYTRKIIATSLDKGIKHPSCKFCWDLEAANQVSPRENFNKTFSDLPHLDQPQILIIKPGNTCNFACRMCNPATSSSWYADGYELTEKTGSFKQYTTEFETIRNSFNKDSILWQQLQTWLPNLKYIDIYGGEPFLIPAMFDLLAFAVEKNYSSNISINISTNCSIFNEKYLEILSKFKQVNFRVSFDSHIPNQLSYIRHKIDVETAFTNAKKFVKFFDRCANVSMMCVCTITPYNVYNIDEIKSQLFDILQIPIAENIVTTDEFDIRHLPIPVKNILQQKIKNTKIKSFLLQNIPGCDIFWPKFCQITDQLDMLRQQSFSATCPEWYSMLQPYWYKSS